MRNMYDSTKASDIPALGPKDVFGGYVDGLYNDFDAMRARFPHNTGVRITALGHDDAHVADVEKGDLTPQTGAAWAKRQITLLKKHPTIYCSESPWEEVKAACRAQGINPDTQVSWWVANYDGIAALPAGAVAKQYRSDTNQNLDYSVVADYWPGVDPAPQPKPVPQPQEEDMPKFVRIDGQNAVYMINGAFKRFIPDQAVFAQEHAIWGDGTVHLVTQEFLDSYGDATPAPISGTPA